ncbi:MULTISPECIES: hypothetical protein [unclassified Pseudoalteromonas]|uniref:hypothetical protein n=1 Tax=unclassified Pseudoalteromonas TaxID=194690 RepID=UPI00110C996F|nr:MULTISPECIES: hypothetical protein [unclassified Pseudoalteromonas]MDN3403273.1 hypothetical protein [Pseudoalteromonas sp. APC 3213]TMS62834.1 hypothetical protein CWC10_04650 [Pseudoalteromonas sp. S3173]|tara:strand:- start:343 stop:1539 length:1197 start_codon:yes stop_codon:yes gene_type:complete
MSILNQKALKKLIVISTLSSLAACGSSENEQTNFDSSSELPQSNTPSSKISGSFKSSYDTSVFYSTEAMPSSQVYGRKANGCTLQYNDYYFETANTLIFGNPNLPESDFKQVATWVENNFDSALSAMQITKGDYFSNRYAIRLDGLKYIRNNLAYKQYDSVSYPSEFDNRNFEQQVDWATKTTKNMDTAQAVGLLVNDPYSPFQTESEAVLEDKLYVCIHETNTANGWGEGNLVGINVGAPSIAVPHEADKIVKHEIIHTIQYALTANFEELGLPRWFSEGQAVLLSGMNVAHKSKHGEYDPTLVVYYNDEIGDQATAYSHYGLAYQYLKDANGQPSIISFMKDVKQVTYDFSKQLNSPLKEYHGYVEAFDKSMKQLNGAPLSVEQYRYDYHSLLTDY